MRFVRWIRTIFHGGQETDDYTPINLGVASYRQPTLWQTDYLDTDMVTPQDSYLDYPPPLPSPSMSCPFCHAVFRQGENSRGNLTDPGNPMNRDTEGRLWMHCMAKHRDRIRVILIDENSIEYWMDRDRYE